MKGKRDLKNPKKLQDLKGEDSSKRFKALFTAPEFS